MLELRVKSVITSLALCTASTKPGTFPSAPDGAPEAGKLLILHPEFHRTLQHKKHYSERTSFLSKNQSKNIRTQNTHNTANTERRRYVVWVKHAF